MVKNRNWGWLGWVFLGVSMLLALLALYLTLISPHDPVWLVVAVILILVIPYALAGAIIAAHSPKNAIGWIFITVGFFQAINIFTNGYGHYAVLTRPGGLPFGDIAIWLGGWTWVLSIGPLSTLLLLLFPDGRLVSPRWRWALWLSIGGISLTTASYAAVLWPVRGLTMLCMQYSTEANQEALARLCPPALIAAPELQPPLSAQIGLVLAGVGALCSIIALVVRFRRSKGVEREQLKWIAAAGVILIVGVFLLFLPLENDPLFGPLLALPLLSLPIAVTVAIRRYHLWDIDLIIRRTLVYGGLTTALALVYFGSVVLLQEGFRAVTGQGSPAAIVLSTLVIAALFTPLRGRMQRLIDSRFYRRRYDAQRSQAAFSSRMRSEVDIDQISRSLLEAVQETIQPDGLSLWIKK